MNSFDLLEFMRSGRILGFGDSKVQIYSGSNSGLKDLIFEDFLN